MALPDPIDFPVSDGSMRALRWGTGDRLILAAHGITANAMAWQAVARQLPSDWSLIAVDLRGRGGSAGLPGSYGFDRHVADLLAVAEQLQHADGSLVLAGHSLGAYAALLTAAADPGRFARVVLVDGALPRPVPEGVDLDAVLAAALGPALERLSMTFADEEEYFDFWRAHPAMDQWSADLADYFRYDLVGGTSGAGPAGALRSGVVAEAVRTDGLELLNRQDRWEAALRTLKIPALLLTAPSGMFGQPPGLLPESAIEYWSAESPQLTTEMVPETNHYSILFDPAATVVAERLAATPGREG